MKALVCGGRNYGVSNYKSTPERKKEAAIELKMLNSTMKELVSSYEITTVIHGNANGADSLAGQWAFAHGLEVKIFAADWKQYGRGAGFIRNQEMIEEKPDLLIAFPGGNGTWDMIKRGHDNGIKVIAI